MKLDVLANFEERTVTVLMTSLPALLLRALFSERHMWLTTVSAVIRCDGAKIARNQARSDKVHLLNEAAW